MRTSLTALATTLSLLLLAGCSQSNWLDHAYNTRLWEEYSVRGRQLYARGDCGAALQSYSGALQQIENNQFESERRISTLIDIGRCYVGMNELERARRFSNRVASLLNAEEQNASTREEWVDLSVLMINLAHSDLKVNDQVQARNDLNSAERFLKKGAVKPTSELQELRKQSILDQLAKLKRSMDPQNASDAISASWQKAMEQAQKDRLMQREEVAVLDCKQALKFASQFKVNDPRKLQTINYYGEVCRRAGLTTEAERALKAQLALAKKFFPDNAVAIAEPLHELARIYHECGNVDQEIAADEEELACLRKVLSAEELAKTFVVKALMSRYVERGQYKECVPLAEMVVQCVPERLSNGTTNTRFVDALSKLGESYLRTGSESKGEQFLERAAALDKTECGAYAIDILAHYREAQGKLPEALKLHGRVLDRLRQLHKAPDIIATREVRLAIIQNELKNGESALSTVNDALNQYARAALTDEETRFRYAQALLLKASLIRDKGKYEESADYAHRALFAFENSDRGGPLVTGCLWIHKTALEKLHRITDYKYMLADAERICDKPHGHWSSIDRAEVYSVLTAEFYVAKLPTAEAASLRCARKASALLDEKTIARDTRAKRVFATVSNILRAKKVLDGSSR